MFEQYARGCYARRMWNRSNKPAPLKMIPDFGANRSFCRALSILHDSGEPEVVLDGVTYSLVDR